MVKINCKIQLNIICISIHIYICICTDTLIDLEIFTKYMCVHYKIILEILFEKNFEKKV